VTGFVIAEIQIGRGVLGLGPIPLGGDVARVQAWQPALVISLTPLPEMQALGAQDLPKKVGREIWRHYPITDFGIPSADQSAAWDALSTEIIAKLREGSRVFVHCRGGCGRSGMIALRLMMLMGEETEGALARLRAIRPCAIETAEQMQWGRG
jgi:protein-tyrosine phosphatase